MVDFTITRQGANPNSQVSEIIRMENEKLAKDVFAKGIYNREIRTILKDRNYEKLSQTAEEEVNSANNNSAIYRIEIHRNLNIHDSRFQGRSKNS